MKKIFLVAVYILSCICIKSQTYHNPVIPGYHPDPSVCRVGDDFYLVNSSFQYFPGVPIFHSKDMVHWQQIGNVLDRKSQLVLTGASSWTGIYAPTIRYDNGTYYMITTNIGHGDNFYVTAKDPKGPWSEPVWLKQQGIDPSLYFEKGKCYMVSNPNDAIWLCEIDSKTGKQLTESRQIWQGTGGRYPEGPHIYFKDGYYYLLISEGGTEYGHMLTIARSHNIYGPYNGNPDNPILCHQRRISENNQIQGTGHGDFVQAQDSSWWISFLGFRTYNGNYHHLGRETFVSPVEWPKDGWPVINNNGTVDTVMNVHTLAQVDMPLSQKMIDFDNFSDLNQIGPEWVYIQNPDKSKYELKNGNLRLYTSASSLTDNAQPTFIGRRQEKATFSIETSLSLEKSMSGDEAGLTVYQINDGHYDICVANLDGRQVVKYRLQVKDLVNENYVYDTEISKAKNIYLRVRGDEKAYHMEYSTDQKVYHEIKTASTCLLSSEVVGGFTGVVLGMYCTGKNQKGYGEFKYFDYK